MQYKEEAVDDSVKRRKKEPGKVYLIMHKEKHLLITCLALLASMHSFGLKVVATVAKIKQATSSSITNPITSFDFSSDDENDSFAFAKH